MRVICLSAVLAAFLAPVPALAVSMVSFEGGGFSDNQSIVDPPGMPTFTAGTMVFSTINPDEPDLGLVVEEYGSADGDPQGFLRDQGGGNDVVDAGLEGRIGQFFMRPSRNIEDRNFVNEPIFRIEFTEAPFGFVSGEIWDIDGNDTQGTERWQIDAFDAGDMQIGSILSPLGTTTGGSSLDGDVWEYVFAAGNGSLFGGAVAADIARIDFTFVGSKTLGTGVGFDNFTVGIVPLPAAGWLLLGGLAALGGLSRAGAGRRSAPR